MDELQFPSYSLKIINSAVRKRHRYIYIYIERERGRGRGRGREG
jgi:hypothetical protein